MRYQGKIRNWKDDKGFGFVEPNGGGQRAFVHIQAFANRGRRPVDNEVVTYEVAYDAMGRAQAENIAFHGETRRPAQASGRGKLPALVGAAFAVFLGAGAAAGSVAWPVPAFYAAASVFTFFAYAWDKSSARHGHWRTPEATLHLYSLLGGWPGALAAQYLLRHKSQKTAFLRVFWVTAAMNAAALAWLLRA